MKTSGRDGTQTQGPDSALSEIRRGRWRHRQTHGGGESSRGFSAVVGTFEGNLTEDIPKVQRHAVACPGHM